MTEPIVNIPLLRKAVEWVEEQDALPEDTRQWMQDVWGLSEDDRLMEYGHSVGCGTAYCVGGKIAEDAGIDWSIQAAGHVAGDLLGLTGLQADELFEPGNTAADIRRIAESIAGERL